MRVGIGSDHNGFALKGHLREFLAAHGYHVHDFGALSEEPVDYPDIAVTVAEAILAGTVERGILVCGTGLGMAYAANRHPGVRAAVAWNPEVARLARAHNDANILVLPARFVNEQEGLAILRAWLAEPFEGGRHLRRVQKIEP